MGNTPEIKIFVSHHKPGYIYQDDIFIPIQVGKKNAKIDLGILGDDIGDNISEKNGNYAELTAQYWVRKNYDLLDIEYVGFCHYRRYISYYWKPKFSKIQIKQFMDFLFYLSGHQYKLEYDEKIILDAGKNIKRFIKNRDVDIYLPKPGYVFGFSNLELQNYHLWDILHKTILELFPEYSDVIKDYRLFMKINLGNIFIMKKDFFVDYSNFLFRVLEKFEDVLVKEDLMKQAYKEPMTAGFRFLGCLGERLLNLWILHKQKEGLHISRGASKIFFEDLKK